MAARIGNVIYWFGCAVAALAVLAGLAEYFAEGNRSDGIAVTVGFFVAALIFWLIGRAVLYILAAR